MASQEKTAPIGRSFKLAVIGCGTMASSVLTKLLEMDAQNPTDRRLSTVILCVTSSKSVQRLGSLFNKFKSTHDIVIEQNQNARAVANADIILLGHKPYQLTTVLSEMKAGSVFAKSPLAGKFVISILAGILPEQIYSASGCKTGDFDIIRVVPNVAATVGESMSVIAQPEAGFAEERLEFTKWMFEQVGKVFVLPVALFDVSMIAVGGYIALTTIAIDGLLDGSVAEGIPRATATQMVAQSLKGLAKLLEEGAHPAQLRESISSPRGCTIKAIMTLEKGNVRSAFSEAIVKGTEHVKIMGKNQD